ncbi:MAG: hypothetical protein Q9197_005811 [Variospora fuerteventurae]
MPHRRGGLHGVCNEASVKLRKTSPLPNQHRYSRFLTHPHFGKHGFPSDFILLVTFNGARSARTQSNVDDYPADGTSTIYASTSTETSSLDCSGSSLVVSTFPVSDIGPGFPRHPINQSAQTFIDELRTAILYASLIANGGNQADICGGINPVSLSNNTGLNGVVVQDEVCASAVIQRFRPALGEALFLSNQIGLTDLTIALFAVQVVSGTFILFLK